EVEFGLQKYQLKSSDARDWDNDGYNDSAKSKEYIYTDQPDKGGWDGSYDDIRESKHIGVWKYGGPAQLDIYNMVYLFVLITIIMAIICCVLIPLAGLSKIPPVAAKIMIVIAIIFVIIGPLYFAIGLPDAIGTDADKKGFEAPPEAGGIMGNADERDQATNLPMTVTEFAPGLGWWLSVISIFLVIISLGFVTSPAPPAPPPLHPPPEFAGGSGGYEDEYSSYGGQPRDQYGPQDRYGPPPAGGRTTAHDLYGPPPPDRLSGGPGPPPPPPPPHSGQRVRRRRPPPPPPPSSRGY
ncbi:MAG: hypothetical protein KAJ51_15380, partial [Thermoplasmata archaeon]|nr:hypothetical protein [Thermoplasmata archaeon]